MPSRKPASAKFADIRKVSTIFDYDNNNSLPWEERRMRDIGTVSSIG